MCRQLWRLGLGVGWSWVSIRGWFGGWVDWAVVVVEEVWGGGLESGGDWWSWLMVFGLAGWYVVLDLGDWWISYPCVLGGVRCV